VGSAIPINDRIRSGIATDKKVTKAQEWHAIADKLAAPIWRSHSERGHYTIVEAIEKQINEELKKLGWRKTLGTKAIALYLRDKKTQIINIE
jgi:hypothetical protein